MTILVIAEHDNATVKSATLHTVACARAVGADIDVLVAGCDCQAAAQAASTIEGVTRVICMSDAALAHQLPEPLAEAVHALVKETPYSHVLFASGTVGKAAMPRLAGLMQLPALSDICAVLSENTFQRYIYAGGVLATVQAQATPVIATVRATAFDAIAPTGASAPVETRSVSLQARGFAFESVQEDKSDRPDLLTARRVCSGGRGLIDEAGFAALQAFADKIGAAVGSTRAVVDMGLAPNETQVGQTGKIVAPELYFAFGISGAIQHVAGMKDSKVIVAVNKDPEAPIFEMCDYYLEADALEVIQELTQKL